MKMRMTFDWLSSASGETSDGVTSNKSNNKNAVTAISLRRSKIYLYSHSQLVGIKKIKSSAQNKNKALL